MSTGLPAIAAPLTTTVTAAAAPAAGQTSRLPDGWGSKNTNPLTARDIEFFRNNFAYGDANGRNKACSVFFRVLVKENVLKFFNEDPARWEFLTDTHEFSADKKGCRKT